MYGSILDPIRNWLTKWKFFKELLRCAQCTGFWAGAIHLTTIVSICIGYGGNWSTSLEQIMLRFVILSLPLQTSAVCYAIDHLIKGVAGGIGDMLYYKNKQLKLVDDQLTVYKQNARTSFTTTPDASPSTSSTTTNSFAANDQPNAGHSWGN